MPPPQDGWSYRAQLPGPRPWSDLSVSSHQDHQSHHLGTTSPGRSVPPHQIARAISPGPRKPHPQASRATLQTISLGRSVPPHWVTSVPSPGHQGRLTGAAGASPISPAGSIPPPRESSAPCAASVARRVRRPPGPTPAQPKRLRGWEPPLLPLRLSGFFLSSQRGPARAAARSAPWLPLLAGGRPGRSESGRRPPRLSLLNLGKTSTSLGPQWALLT